jgi:class 3 adenylate cyclase/predicted ATPase
MTEIEQFLAGLGLSQYAGVFADNALDLDVLPDLDEADFEKLGILLGHRKKLLRAIAALGQPAAAVIPAAPVRDATPPAEAERRQITVLFSDLAGSTSLSQRLDPEEMREVLGAYQALVADCVAAEGGTLAKYLGDGVLAYFGWPAAHDDDAARGVRAGRAIIAGVAALNRRFAAALGDDLAIRVGIHTGLVVVGEMGSGATRESNAIVGETPNLAARLQGLAAPNTVAISAATWRLVQRLFACRALGRLEAKGVADGLETYEVSGETAPDETIDGVGGQGPLVGREQEIGLLLDRWGLAREGYGQAVLLSGEAGIGKSRLLQAFRDRTADDGAALLVMRCSPQHRNAPLHPVISLLDRRLGNAAGDAEDIRAQRLAAHVATLGTLQAETPELLAKLLGLPSKAAEAPSEAQRRRRILGALIDWLIATAARDPVALAVEDAHWADASTLELLGLLLGQLATMRLFAVISSRPEFVPPWPPASHIAAITLGRLRQEQVAAVIRHIAGGKSLPESVLQQLLAKTDGVPLFVEELTRMVIGSDLVVEEGETYQLTPQAAVMAIPSTLQDSLTARLDRLSGARRLAQLAATIGREFGHELLALVAGLSPEDLDRDLTALCQNDILHQRGMPPQATYSFKHALIQEAAYASLLKTTRQTSHARIAEILKTNFAAIAETSPELLAQHYALAGLAQPAIDYYRRASELAHHRSGYQEAAAHCAAALELLPRVAAGAERDATEIDLRLMLGLQTAIIEGAVSARTEQLYSDARTLAERIGDGKRLFAAIWGLWYNAFLDARITTSAPLADQLTNLGTRLGDEDLQLEAYHSRWATRFQLGDFASVSSDAGEGIVRYDPERHAAHRFSYGGHDTCTCAHGFSALVAAIAGQADEAAAASARGMAVAEAIGEPICMAHGRMFLAMTHQMRGDLDACLRLGEAILDFHRGFELPQYNGAGVIIGGWAMIETGDIAGARRILETVERQFRGPLNGTWSSYLHALVADIEAGAGAVDQALARLRQNLEFTRAREQRFFEAEQLRRIGELTLQQSAAATAEAEQHLRAALAIARRQSANAFELRAALSLARLLGDQGRRGEATEILAPAVAIFAQTGNPPRLGEARGLLTQLG